MSRREELSAVLTDPERHLDSTDPAVRRIAVAACAGLQPLPARIAEMLFADTDPGVRRECAEALGRNTTTAATLLRDAYKDDSPEVREAVVTALGELEDGDAVAMLLEIARDDAEDRLVREAAVASLGAIGDNRAVPVLLTLIESGPPQIRRRCVPALTVFDGDEIEAARNNLLQLYEQVFNHRAFTGRSGAMFGFEGLGSIYWHMVSKLLLAIQENFFAAREGGADEEICSRLAALYYAVRDGIGFNKTPAEYGAFPTDPYSHTPKHAGAQQPGMTGQVKEDVLSRFGELGVVVRNGAISFEPNLLRKDEFLKRPETFRFIGVNGAEEIELEAGALGFTCCQVPIIYKLAEQEGLKVVFADGTASETTEMWLDEQISSQVFDRTGEVRRIIVSIKK
jgi:hypothetical protein